MIDQPQENVQAQGADEPGGCPLKQAASIEDKRRKRSSVYIYLVVLFGAAFLMLLLAYFVQQRNSESAISDLRSSMNLSREELMEEIDGLKKEKAALEEENTRLQEERDKLDVQLDELQDKYDDTAGFSAMQEKELQNWASFWALEADFLAGEYESCAQFFQTLPADNIPYPMEPGVQERVEEIYTELVNQGVLAEGEGWMAPEEGEAGQ